MQGRDLIIGIVVVAVILIGGYLFVTSDSGTGTMATSTVTVNENTDTGTGTAATAPQSAAPVVTTETLVIVSNSTAAVNGRVNPKGAPTTYWYEYGSTSGLGTRTSAQTIGSGFVALNAPTYITGLSANSTYYFRLVAQNRYGTVVGNTLAFTTNSTPPPAGKVPTVRTDAATDITRTAASLVGRVNPNGGDTSYWFEYGTTNDLGGVTSFELAGNGTESNSISVSLSNLHPLTKYYYRLNAQNKYGTVTGLTLSFTTSGPAAPGVPTVNSVSATAVSTSSATFNGHVNPNGAETNYWFEYGTDSLLGDLIGNTTHQTSAGAGMAEVPVASTITGLSSGTKYYFRLVGQNSYGTTYSTIVNFRTK